MAFASVQLADEPGGPIDGFTVWGQRATGLRMRVDGPADLPSRVRETPALTDRIRTAIAIAYIRAVDATGGFDIERDEGR